MRVIETLNETTLSFLNTKLMLLIVYYNLNQTKTRNSHLEPLLGMIPSNKPPWNVQIQE